MLGYCGEYIIESTNNTDNIVDKIKEYETNLNLNTVPKDFWIKKIGIMPNKDCIVKINGRDFNILKNTALEIGYDVMDVSDLYAQTQGVKLVIRYLY